MVSLWLHRVRRGFACEEGFELSRVYLEGMQRTQFSSVQFSRSVWLFATLWTSSRQTSLSITTSQSLPKLMPIESVMPSNHLILCRLLLLPSIFPSIRIFSNESTLHIRWPEYWGFSFNISPSNEHSSSSKMWKKEVGKASESFKYSTSI